MPGTKLSDVSRVFSHPVALEQCRKLFRSHPAMKAIPFYDTAGSLRHIVAEQLDDAAAIAPRAGGGAIWRKDPAGGHRRRPPELHPLSADQQAHEESPAANKTSLAFALQNVPGALFKALSVFALRDISLSKIESRPIVGRPWEYVFFADINRGHDEAAQNAIRHLGEIAEFVKVLGVYPAAKQPKPDATLSSRTRLK